MILSLVAIFCFILGLSIGADSTRKEAKRELDCLFKQYCTVSNAHDNLIKDFQLTVTELENQRNLCANYLDNDASKLVFLRYKKACEILESIKYNYPTVLVET